MGGVKAGNLRQGTCSGKRLHQIEVAVKAAVEGGGGKVGQSLILMRSAIFVSCRFVFINAYYLVGIVRMWNILMFTFSINSPELLEMAAIDSMAVIAVTHRIVTQQFEGP